MIWRNKVDKVARKLLPFVLFIFASWQMEWNDASRIIICVMCVCALCIPWKTNSKSMVLEWIVYIYANEDMRGMASALRVIIQRYKV